MSFGIVKTFEDKIAEYFGSKYAVAVDCCTHGLELSLRYTNADKIIVPKQTYLSVPMLSDKLNRERDFINDEWEDYYYITNNIVDAAVLWKQDSYIPSTLMVLSFQFKKHLNLGRGGAILTDNIDAWYTLKGMSYDGREPESEEPWANQDINTIGYHYYMTPETAYTGVQKLSNVDFQNKEVKKWSYRDYPVLTEFNIFKNG
jgi:dTDP-4-amino-4,6-dideoxygalactose transaminase